MIAAYVVLDGFDLGAGIVHLVVARTDAERRLVLRSIGPFWDGNEVWLLAAGGTLFFAFPALYASSFSGFYLPLMIVLWLLILRGIAIEFRGHVDSPTWKPLWDAVFSLSSALLAIFYGAALGNVLRGVPLDAAGEFFEPLWTAFPLGPATATAHGGRADRQAFAGSCVYLAGMLASAAFGIYPCLLPAVTDPAYALTVHNAAAAEHGLRVGLAWWIPGMALAVAYSAFVYRTFAEKARVGDEGY